MSRVLTSAIVLVLLAATHRTQAADEALLVAPPDSVQYRLASPRVEDERSGRKTMVIPYTRTREGEGGAILAGRSSDGRLQIMGFSPSPNEASGEFRLTRMFGMNRDKGYNYEFYLVTSARWAERSYGRCLVSNVVRIGNPGTSTTARPWNAEEEAAYQKHLIGKKPPATRPEGYVGYQSDTPLTPGMPVKVGYYGDWRNAELVSIINRVLVGILYEGEDKVTRKPLQGWVAFDPGVLRRVASDPSQFKPSVRLLPGGTIPLPRDAIELPADTKLLIGAPLLVEWAGKWITAYVLNADAESVKVKYEGYSSGFNRAHPHSKYAIQRETLSEMTTPDAPRRFAQNLKAERKSSADAFPDSVEVEGGWAKPEPKRFKEYKVTIEVPRRAQFVPEDLRLEPGAPLAACWANKWNPITVLSENDDGTVNVRWDGHSAWDCSMNRSQLIIQDKTVRKLLRKFGGTPADLFKTVRTWTDASGQHKIEARLVSRTATHVKLETDAGREVTLPLDKLCDQDRALLADIEQAVENPFE